jgi:Asp-tRNA(Asn)/Glu-tRNA(Gln) amidotransferase A subunit family amidase
MKRHARYIVLIIFCIVQIRVCIAQTFPTATIEPFFDISLTPSERDSLLEDLKEFQLYYKQMHASSLVNAVPMSMVFDPVPVGFNIEASQQPIDWGLPTKVDLPADRQQLAFFPVYKLAMLIKQRKISSVELTSIYLTRLKKFSDTLSCTVTLMEKKALLQAKRADEELAAGKYRGLLHGIPYGLKDLLATDDAPTTWGAEPFKNQLVSETAFVVRKLEQAGAVLVAKLSLGSLAMGDIWYGGVTKNPWNLRQGSSGSSAGSASATVAGLVAFAIGSETLGSIVSPSTRCGASGFRPSFGMVSRSGAMALSYSMDKIGPLCRSALDCAIVLNSIKGKDDNDRSTREVAFNYSSKKPLSKLRIGYLKSAFEADYFGKANDEVSLKVLRSLGLDLKPVEWPNTLPVNALIVMLSAEAAASFDELTRSNQDDQLTDQRKNAWPNYFRSARFIPAVEYINASRFRWQLIQQVHEVFKEFDVIVCPSFGGSQLLTTNLTGNPCVVVPNGFSSQGTPTSISFIGKLYGDAAVAKLAVAFQEATSWEEMIPPDFK